MTTEPSAAAFSWQLLSANRCNDDPAVSPAGLWRTFYRINASVKVIFFKVLFNQKPQTLKKRKILVEKEQSMMMIHPVVYPPKLEGAFYRRK